MVEPRYHFSTDGMNTFGPVTVPALRQLFADGALTSASYLLAEGEKEWQPLNSDFFSAEPGANVEASPTRIAGEVAPTPSPASAPIDEPADSPVESLTANESFTETAFSEVEDSAPLELIDEEPPVLSEEENTPAEGQLALDFSAPAAEEVAEIRPEDTADEAPFHAGEEALPEETAPVEEPPMHEAPEPIEEPAALTELMPEEAAPPAVAVQLAGPTVLAIPPASSPLHDPTEPAAPDTASDGAVRAAFLSGISLTVGLVTSLWLTHAAASSPGYRQNWSYTIGVFVGGLLFLVLGPFLISLIFRRSRRPLVFALGVVLFAVLAIVGASQENQEVRIVAAEQALQQKTKVEAQKQIQAKGYYEQDPQEATKQMQTLKDQVGTGDSAAARISRDLLVVVSQLLEKTKLCDQLANACNFDVTTISGLDDIGRRQAAIGKLHSAQGDVVLYLQSIDAHCHDVLAKDNLGEATISQATAGFRKAGHIDLIVTLWQAQSKLASDHIDRLDFLAKSWGVWSVKDGKLTFPDEPSLYAYNVFVHAIQADVKTISDVQKQIYK